MRNASTRPPKGIHACDRPALPSTSMLRDAERWGPKWIPHRVCELPARGMLVGTSVRDRDGHHIAAMEISNEPRIILPTLPKLLRPDPRGHSASGGSEGDPR